MADLQRSPALPSFPLSASGFFLRDIGAVAKVRVQALRSRGMPAPTVTDPRLPDRPNTASGSNPTALWKAPDDWLVYSRTLSPDALINWVAAIPSSAPLIATDVSSSSAIFELSGARAIDVLLRDCTLDLEGNAVPVGACAQTLFAQTTVLIHRPDQATWLLFIERSVAQHVWDWLLDSSV